jgi:anti-sigma B factor antagonist
MEPVTSTFQVRSAGESIAVLAINGDVTPASEPALMHAYGEATATGARAIVLDFEDLAYMNSGGIGLLVTLLVRAQRGKQRLLAYGLNDHYRQILSLTRLDEAIAVHGSAEDALTAAR